VTNFHIGKLNDVGRLDRESDPAGPFAMPVDAIHSSIAAVLAVGLLHRDVWTNTA
jgi:hypothetical protein